MNFQKLFDALELVIFRHRPVVIALFTVATALLLYQATQLRLDAGFTKNIPLNHPYMQTYMQHRKDFGGANSVLIAVESTQGDIYQPHYFTTLKAVHDELFFIPGVDRAQVKSLFSPSTRFVEVVEDGFAGGPVIPADFVADSEGLAHVKANVEKAGIIGRLVSEDGSAAMVSAQLLDFNPETGEKLDLLALADQLEQKIRAQFEDQQIRIHIIGFSKMIGDIAEGAKGVVLFFVIALIITTLLVYLFARSMVLTLLPIICSLIAVVWQIGLLNVLGFGLDPMSILIPFLVFAIGVSHGVQMINASKRGLAQGLNSKVAAQQAFRSLLLPGGIALLSDTIGFMTILYIDIGIIRELAITASLGVGMIIFTNLILLPVMLSYANLPKGVKLKAFSPRLCALFAKFATPRYAIPVAALTLLVFAAAAFYSRHMAIGDLHAGSPELHQDSRYNQDTFFITDKFTVSVDILTVLTESRKESCTYHDDMQRIDDFGWRLANVPGVQSVVSLPTIAKQVNAGFNEGNPRWHVLPNNTASLVQAVSRIPTSSGLLNADCSVMPIYLFLKDHKAETIQTVIDAVVEKRAAFETEQLKFKLASGPVGVMAAKNEAVSAAQMPMLGYVYAAVIVLCLISFRSLRATISVVLPLFVVSTLAQALMVALEIGLTVATLPVIALGVGIGVDYGIYILSTMSVRIRSGDTVAQAYVAALRERGNAVLFTGITLAIGVSTWFFSALKFQVDMGILLTFMFLVNMLAAVLILPAVAAILWPKNHAPR